MRPGVVWMCHQRKMRQRLLVSQVKSICASQLSACGSRAAEGMETYVHAAHCWHGVSTVVHPAMAHPAVIHVRVVHLC